MKCHCGTHNLTGMPGTGAYRDMDGSVHQPIFCADASGAPYDPNVAKEVKGVLRSLPLLNRDPNASKSVEEVLLLALDYARKGELGFVIITGRNQKDGAVRVITSQPLDEIQGLGVLEAAKVLLMSKMQKV